jgi:hypothetical protein
MTAFDPQRHLWLDLEDTVILPVINGWQNTEVINIDRVKAFMSEFKPHVVNVFSFAIWNHQQLSLFNRDARPALESALGVCFSLVPTVDDDILPVCTKMKNLGNDSVTFSDMSDFWGKQEAFRLYIRDLYKSNSTHVKVAFLDDAVYNEFFNWPNLKVKGQILNIDEMEEPNGRTKDESCSFRSTGFGNRKVTSW